MANLIDTDGLTQSEDYKGFGQRHTVRVSGGRIYATHITDIDNIEVHYSDNDGSSWSLDTTFSGLSNPHSLSLCLSEDEDIFLGFGEDSHTGGYDFDVVIKKRDYSSGTWSEVLRENIDDYDASISPYPLITYNKDVNRLHVFWTYYDTDEETGLRNKYSDNKGSSWSSGSDYSITIDTKNYITALGLDTHPTTGDVYIHYQKSSTNGAFTIKFNNVGVYQSQIFSDGGYTYRGGSLLVDNNGDIWTAFIRWAFGVTRIRIFKNGSAVKGFGDDGFDVFRDGMLSLGKDNSNDIHVFYTKETDDKLYERTSKDSWNTETCLTSGDGLRPSSEQHALSGSSEIHFVFYVNP